MVKAQGRMIRKTINESDSFASLSEKSQVLFCLLIPHFNAHGKQNGNPYTIKGMICPKISYFTIPVIEKCLQEITEKTDVKWFKLSTTYFIHALNFENHQELREDRMGQDLMPDCPEELRSTPGLLPDNSGYKIKVKVKEKVKVKYLETVFLTTDQYKSLVDKYGEQITGELIELLDAYKVSNGKKYKDDMGAIRSWVIKRWSTDHGRELKPMTDRERLKAKIIADEKRT